MGQFKERIIISIVGNTNVGKSTLFNLISGQKDKSIVDNTAGTTADSVKTLMEIHQFGAVKLIDTAGINEKGILGNKKKNKTIEVIDNSDLILFVIKDGEKNLTNDELETLNYIKLKNKQFFIIYNNFYNCDHIELIKAKSLVINCNDFTKQLVITNFIINNFKKCNNNIEFFPNINLYNKYVMLIIPLDEESPESRLLRPQNMAIEKLLRIGAIPILYKPNLKELRNKNINEINNFNKILKDLKDIAMIIIDSQAFDCISDYIPNNVIFTSFSILMTNFMSNGNIVNFVNGVKELDNLQDNDKILIVEACKHDRKCNDIATIQLPKAITKYSNKNISFDFNFGETFLSIDELKKYKIIVMCGGCMIDKQEYNTRLNKIQNLNIKYTNYGMVFSYIKNKQLLNRCVEIFYL